MLRRYAIAVVIFLTAVMVTAAERDKRRDADRDQRVRSFVALQPNERDFAETEEGCVEERVKDYLQRHSDFGVIDANVMLELSRAFRDEFDRDRGRKSILSIPGSVWTSLGPTNGGGRATAIAPHPSTANTIYIGAAGGGVWRTMDGGTTWTSLTDSIPNLSVGALALAPSQTSTLYLGTGEGGYAGDFIPGIGFLYSTDGGANWVLPSTVVAEMFYKFSVHPTTATEIVAGTNHGGLRTTNAQNGTNVTWTTVIRHDSAGATVGYGDVTDIVRDPTNAQVLYASTYDVGYWCARYTCYDPNNYAGSTVLKSIDGGQTWSVANSGLPTNSSTQYVSRIALAIAPSNTQVLYAATSLFDNLGNSTSHIYKTTDGGGSWSDTTLAANADSSISHYHRSAGDQVSYDNTIVVNPTDANTVVAGGVRYVRTTDGGATWTRGFQSPASVHVDVHELKYNAANVLYVACDGGIYSSTDNAGTNSTDRNATLVTRQYYTLQNDAVNRNRMFGGMQDNGTNRRPDAGGTAWDFMTGGDGFGVAVIPTVPSIVLTSYQNENFYRTSNAGAVSPTFGVSTPKFPSAERKPFATKIIVDPGTPQTVYTGTTRVWKSTDAGESWMPLPITTNDGSTWDQPSQYTINALAVAKSNPSVIMIAKGISDAAHSYGTAVFRSTNGGASWATVNSGLPVKFATSIDIDPNNSSIAYISLSGVSGTSVYKTTNGGASWNASGNGLPQFSAQVVKVDPTDSTTIYCGTDVGVYRSTDNGGTWTRFGTGMPAVSVYDLQALNDGSILRAVTHGRGAWELTVTGVTNHAPTASISTPATATVSVTKGQSLSFSGSVSDIDGGDSASASWTFPDSWSTAAGTSASHTFNRIGVFPVTLLATDTHGAVNASSVQVTVPQPGDGCLSPMSIPAGPYPMSIPLTTTTASVETGTDPGTGAIATTSCYPYLPGPTLWLSFTPAASGTYRFYTCGSSVSTVIAIFTGSCGALTQVANSCSVNGSPNPDCSAETSYSQVTLSAGTPYLIWVTNYYYQDLGAVNLTISQAALSGTVVASISPSVGPSTGNTPVIISGSGFSGTPAVTIGGTAATGVTVVSPQLLTAVTPAHAAGIGDVVVTSAATTGTLSSAFTFTASVTPGAVTNLVATATGTTTSSLTWTAASNASTYEVARATAVGGPFTTVGTPGTNSFSDSGLSGNTTYIYKVRGIGSGGEQGAYSSVDVATTIVFTDPTLTALSTLIKTAHFNEARTAVNAMRTAAGIGVFPFTDLTLTATSTKVKAIHLTELRTALDAARLALGLPALSYTNTITATTTKVFAIDLTEIRNGVK